MELRLRRPTSEAAVPPRPDTDTLVVLGLREAAADPEVAPPGETTYPHSVRALLPQQ